ncbi:MAG: hypothetical protein BCS36_00410 [Desulfovibrio sp. MES5]|nr:MAG: hypothetical protein BCS36_00410 [Desulfovibrio sp. MES5]
MIQPHKGNKQTRAHVPNARDSTQDEEQCILENIHRQSFKTRISACNFLDILRLPPHNERLFPQPADQLPNMKLHLKNNYFM